MGCDFWVLAAENVVGGKGLKVVLREQSRVYSVPVGRGKYVFVGCTFPLESEFLSPSPTGKQILITITHFFRILTATSLGDLVPYVICGFVQTWFRAVRYRLILATSADEVPGMWRLFLVSMSRNMFVDMLPARLGELSYIAMLNRGYNVAVEACLSSLALSFVFDLVALGLLLLALLGIEILSGGFQFQLLLYILMILFLCAFLLFVLYYLLQKVGWLLNKEKGKGKNILSGVADRIGKLVLSLRQAKDGKIFGKILWLSLGVRTAKYVGLYFLFLAVVQPSFTNINFSPGMVLPALVSAEAGAALPVPTFLSFGTYETGGALAMIALGAEKAASVAIMLSLHIWSQVVDYSLGLLAFILFVFSVDGRAEREQPGSGKGRRRYLIILLLVLIASSIWLAFQYRGFKKIGSLSPPAPGEAVVRATGGRPNKVLTGLNGFIVWSSNRFGNHDIVMLTLPDQKLVRVTTNPYTEYFPRISPDGKRLVFCRSQEPWVSQRNDLAWDVYLLDLASKNEKLLAKNANTPTWSADGTKVYFQHNSNQFVVYDLAKDKATVLFKSGKNLNIPAATSLETPDWSAVRRQCAVTLRGSRRMTALIDAKGHITKVGDGCELTWAPDSSYLYYVDHGGKETNQIYKVDPVTLKRRAWFDSPTEYSHEYFPKVANTGDYMVYGASTGGHEHDQADYEIFLWKIGTPAADAVRISYYTGNDCWPDIFLKKSTP